MTKVAIVASIPSMCSDEGQVAKYSTPLKISISQFWLFEVIKKPKTIWKLFKTGPIL